MSDLPIVFGLTAIMFVLLSISFGLERVSKSIDEHAAMQCEAKSDDN